MSARSNTGTPIAQSVAVRLQPRMSLTLAAARAPERPGDRQQRRALIELMAIGEFAGWDQYVMLAPIAAEQHTLAQALQHGQVAFFPASSFGARWCQLVTPVL